MIKPLNNVSNVTFGNGLDKYQEQIKSKVTPEYNLVISPGSEAQEKPKKSFKEGIADVFKGYNNTVNSVKGVVKGTIEGIALGGLAGIVVKNINGAKKSTNKNVIAGVLSDVFGFAGKAFSGISKVFKQSPMKSFKDALKVPVKYFKNYLGKSNVVAGLVAVGVAGAVFATNIIKSKINANRKNADVDHSLNLKH